MSIIFDYVSSWPAAFDKAHNLAHMREKIAHACSKSTKLFPPIPQEHTKILNMSTRTMIQSKNHSVNRKKHLKNNDTNKRPTQYTHNKFSMSLFKKLKQTSLTMTFLEANKSYHSVHFSLILVYKFLYIQFIQNGVSSSKPALQ